jgi:hypothetical protein
MPSLGIWTADWYAQSAVECVGPGTCNAYFGKGFNAGLVIKEAAQKLTYGGTIDSKAAATSVQDMAVLLGGIELPKHAMMAFPHVLTTPREDRDSDMLETEGAIVDPKMPMLWQHIHTLPIGKMVKVLEHSKKVLKLASVLLDLNELTSDAAKLIEAEALRFSHGFRALEFVERKDQSTMESIGGFRVTKFEIMEESLVSVPSNVDAEISLWDAGKLKSDLFKKHAKSLHDAIRKTQGIGMDFRTGTAADVAPQAGKTPVPCSCQKHDKAGSPALRKSFDVDRERLVPATTEIDWVARFIGCGAKDIKTQTTGCGGILRGGFMEALDVVLAGSKVCDTRNFDDRQNGQEVSPIYETIAIKSDRRKNFLTEGVRFYAHSNGWKFAIHTQDHWGTQHYVLYSADQEKGQKLFDDAWAWLDQHNPLKGEAFSLTGKFLERTGIQWEDVFLDEKNEAALKRAVKIINEKGAQAHNRGIVLAGPPGTGKTLSGRVMLNEAKATFIWVSAKEFWEVGSFHCFSGAFDLARKLAPAIVLYEDVDNWIDPYSVDLIKGEMDGLSQSSGVTTVLTTNFPEKLPAALIDRPGRFHDVLEIHLPSKDVRLRMLSKWAKVGQDGGATSDAIEKLAADTEGLSGAHLYELANFAKAICDEDSCDLDSALTKALTKVHEQRELISAGQLSGSSYRPRKGAGMSRKEFPPPKPKPGEKPPEKPAAEDEKPEGEPGVCKGCKAEAPLNKDGYCAKCVAAMEEPPKSTTGEAKSSPEAVMEFLLSAEPELLRRVAKAADGLLKVHESQSQGESLRKLLN